jgi:anti-sigma-K factor RskA
MSSSNSSSCNRIEELRDYAFDECAAEARKTIERHISGCGDCAAELDRLRLTTTALRMLPEREIPQRIAFVSDKVFESSPAAGWFDRAFNGFWTSGARLGFASACVLAVAIVISAYRITAPPQPAGNQPMAQITAAAAPVDLSKQIDVTVGNAVTKAVAQVREEDAKLMTAALEASERRHEQEHQALLVAMQENLTVLQKRLSTFTMLASNDSLRTGGGQ